MNVTSVAVAAWLCALGATGDLGLDTSVALRAGARRGTYGGSQAATSGEAELLPRLELGRDGRLRLSATYAPAFLLPIDVSGGAPELRDWEVLQRRATVTHGARLGMDVSMPTWTLSGSADGAYGKTELLTRAEGAGQAVPTSGRIPYMFASANAGVTAEPTRRLGWALQGGAFLRGGADDAARLVLPVQREVRADASVRWNMTRRDVLSAVISATGSRVERAGEAAYLRTGAGWRHFVRPVLTVDGAGGVAATVSRNLGAEDLRGAVPWATGALSYTPASPHPSARLQLALEPAIDGLTGAIDMRGTVDASVSWPPTQRWSLAARASAAALEAWNGYDTLTRGGGPDTLVGTAEVRAGRQLGARFTLAMSVRASAQTSDRPDVAAFREVGAFFELTARRPFRL